MLCVPPDVAEQGSAGLSGHCRLGEGRHAVVAGQCGLHDPQRRRRTGSLAQPHAQIEQRIETKLIQHTTMPGSSEQ